MAVIPRPFGMSLPPSVRVDLPGRGTTCIRDVKGPAGAPVLVLLHGLGADADLNWFACFGPLAQRYRVVAIDHRGHGEGIPTTSRFRLADCADDVAALCDVLGVDKVVAVGYSMGGPIAQLAWHRHRDRIAGLVLCATAARFARSLLASRVLPGLAVAARLSSRPLPQNPLVRQLAAARVNDPGLREWLLARERRSDPRALLEAAAGLSRFSSADWLTAVDVPTAVVITQFDRLVPRARQEELVRLIPTATEHRVLGDHAVCTTRPDLFVPKLLDATAAVTGR